MCDHRRHKQRQAIYMADDGQAPPLYCKASPALQWGSMYGTEHLDPSGLRKWKATAVHVTLLLFLGKSAISCLDGFSCSLYRAYFSHAFCDINGIRTLVAVLLFCHAESYHAHLILYCQISSYTARASNVGLAYSGCFCHLSLLPKSQNALLHKVVYQTIQHVIFASTG